MRLLRKTLVLLALASSLLEQHRDAEVPALAARLVARHPELIDDERLKHVVLAAASSSDTRAATDAFALLTGPMGETGAGCDRGERNRRSDWLGQGRSDRAELYHAYDDHWAAPRHATADGWNPSAR